MKDNDEASQILTKGTFVKIRYYLRTEDGEYIKGHLKEGFAYLEFFTGYNQVLPALENKLIGRGANEKLHLQFSPEEAFGPYSSDNVKEKDYEAFPEGRDLQEGKWVLARDGITHTAYGYFVKKKESDRIIVDYNHPLAGKSLIYDLEIIEVRPSTLEERSLLRPCEEEDADKL